LRPSLTELMRIRVTSSNILVGLLAADASFLIAKTRSANVGTLPGSHDAPADTANSATTFKARCPHDRRVIDTSAHGGTGAAAGRRPAIAKCRPPPVPERSSKRPSQ